MPIRKVADVLSVFEGTDYSQKLGRMVETVQEIGLYKVTLADESTHFVLAESGEGAIGQATCRVGRSIEDQRQLEVGAVYYRIPVRLRGWGATEF